MDHAVIDRFRVSEAPGYSQYWRRDKSPVEALELARLLSGLRKVASLVGRNVGTLVWSGMKAENGLQIDPALVMGAYPVPSAKVDLVTGLTIHLAYSRVEWSRLLMKLAGPSKPVHPRYAAHFDFYLDFCERVYLDCLSNRSPFGLYTEAHRLWAIKRALAGPLNPPTISHLLNLWWEAAADRNGRRYTEEYVDRSARGAFQRNNLERFYKEPMRVLNSMAGALINECPRIDGVTQRCKHRLNLYLSTWARLADFIKFWPIDSKDVYFPTSEIDQNILDSRDGEKENELGTNLVLPEEVKNATFHTLPVYTDDVRRVVQNKDDVVSIRGNDWVLAAPNRIDQTVLHRLSIVLRSAAERDVRVSRGQRTGKIDRRRLYRTFTVGTVFKLIKTDFLLRSNIVVLVDATGSMAAPLKWENLETAYQTLFAALRKFNKRARLLAYNEREDTCLLTEIFRDDKFYNVQPRGKTASGEAIIATVRSLKTSYRKSYLIHITDGASNWGCGVNDAISLCRREGINLLTLGIGCNADNKRSLREEYGGAVAFIERNEALPHLMSNLLRHSQWK